MDNPTDLAIKKIQHKENKILEKIDKNRYNFVFFF